MAAPRKKKLDYFPMDSDFFSDKKIKIVLARFGADGVTLYLYTICEIYKNSYYITVDDDFYYIVSADLNMSSEKVKQILNFLLKRSLFDDKLFQSDKVLTSAGIQKRYQEAVRERAKKNRVVVQDYWLLDEKETQPYIDVTCFSDRSPEGADISQEKELNSQDKTDKKKKEKQSKENETKGNGTVPDMKLDLEEVILLFQTCGFKLKDHTSKELSALMEEYSTDWLMKAINRAAVKGKLTLGYVKGILNNWRISGGIEDEKTPSGLNWEDL